MRSEVRVLLLMVAVLGMPASVFAASEVETLRERATAYWQARAAHSDAVYDYYAPVDKGGPHRNQIREGRKAKYASVEVDKVEITDETGIVHVKVEIASLSFASPALAMALEQNPEARRRTVRDEWVQVDGTWYRSPPLPFGGIFMSKKTLAPDNGASQESSGDGDK